MIKDVVIKIATALISVVLALALFSILSLVRDLASINKETYSSSPTEILLTQIPTEKEVVEPLKQSAATTDIELDASPSLTGVTAPRFSPNLSQLEPGESSSSEALAVFDESSVDEPAKAIYKTNPDYPLISKRLKEQGVVTVEFLISKTGTVSSPHVVASPSQRLAESVVNAVLKWRFKPAELQKQAVMQRAKVSINFSLEG